MVGAQLRIGFTLYGQPLSGSVAEKNYPGGDENPSPEPLSKQGTFLDWLAKHAPSSTPLDEVRDAVDNGNITIHERQILTITSNMGTFTADWTRTLTNLDARGKTVGWSSPSWTTPVITQIGP